MKSFFHLSSGFVIPLMPKCGLSSTHAAIARHITSKRGRGLKLGRRVIGHDNKPALVPIRDVHERFRSAVWQVNRGTDSLTVDWILDGLESGEYHNQHFQSQSKILASCDGCESVKLYRFPEDFQQMLLDGGLEPLDEHRNKSENKPELTTTQASRVAALYADDVDLRSKVERMHQAQARLCY